MSVARPASHTNLHVRWHKGNQLDLLQNGEQYFPALFQAIDAAQTSIHLETYIFNLDRTGLRVLDHLQQACARGVKVRAVIDGFGSQAHAQAIGDRFVAMGAQHRIYRPEPQGWARFLPNPRRLRRLHRKVTVIDGRVAFVGGINILDDFEGIPNDGLSPRPRFDFVVRMRGPLVSDVISAQNRLWLRMSWRRRDDWEGFSRRLAQWRKWRLGRRAEPMTGIESGLIATLVLRDNVRYRQTIENVYVQAIRSAKTRIVIANAYFFPGRRLRQSLEDAAARGVRVCLLLQGRSEYPMQYRAGRFMYGKLLDDGIEVYEYQPSYLHAKVAAIDALATVGSSNLDPFSLLLAREANVFVDDADFASRLVGALDEVMHNDARRVTSADLQKRSFLGRWFDAVSYFMLRVGVALTGKSSLY
ncbi:MAG: cardiolipin synthase ClsB [Candidimonas sp.]|nr:MAG: cardiolipin synthase ClsB [Candidimonas sp.]TAM22353.1 MAG: cardiolipin synthase ClsB [Candidimonas sp.]TAM76767.1 MAG: cardiolipin synthase ClsB [Candidimonas sp.]